MIRSVCRPAALLCVLCTAVAAAPLTIVEGGRSRYSIYLPPDSPPSVQAAAADLAQYLQQATGAALPVVDQPRPPMIALGDSAAAREAGLSAQDIAPEGFRIATRGENLYLLGPDTADGATTPGGGTSAGTRNGVSTFLEDYLGVRWLMPGPHGDYVPKSPTLTVPEVDRTEAPFFVNRRLPYIQERRAEVKTWWARQKLGYSLALSHGHNFERTITTDLFDEHPDWFAERGGRRIPPTGRYKLCLTNTDMCAAFAEAAIKWFRANPSGTTFSLSPSDSSGWCECAKCSALYEEDPNGKRSVTPAVVYFYDQVARRVAKEFPDKLLAGYVYAEYVYPPKNPVPLPPNVFLVWAPSFDYGYQLFRPEFREQWDRLVAQWTKVTDRLAYYDLPVNVSTEMGALNPPGLKILKFLYARLKANGMKGVYVYGIDAWGRAAPLNYLLAKLAWNPDAEVEALLDEYCAKAYGAGGAEVGRLFRLLDEAMEKYYIADQNVSYVMTPGMLKDVHAANFAEVERLYTAAEAKITDPDAKARLAMIGDNLKVLHWNLRGNKLVEQPEASRFYLTDADLRAFMVANRNSLALQPSGRQTATVKPVRAEAAGPVKVGEPVKRFALRGGQRLVVLPTGDQPAELRFSSVSARGKMLTYATFNAAGEAVDGGVMGSDSPLLFNPPGPYQVVLNAGSASFGLSVTGARWAVDATVDGQGLHLLNQVSPLYFQVPAGTAAFHLSLKSDAPGESAAATLIGPDGGELATFDTTALMTDRKKFDQPASGWYKLVLAKAPTGVLDDVWVRLEGIPAFFSFDPAAALSVSAD